MNHLDISSTITFNSNSIERWQTVYISQLYDTFFAIYGKFKFDRNSKSLELNFKTVNYKGILNIGIRNLAHQEKRTRVRVIDIVDGKEAPKYLNVLSIRLDIAALTKEKKESSKNPHTGFPYHISNYLDRKKTIKLNDTHITDIEKNNLYLEIDRKLFRMNESDYLTHEIFDTEFYYRDGLRIPNLLDREYADGEKLNPRVNQLNQLIDQNDNVIKDTQKTPKGSGGICPKGYSLIVF